ncbi:MAG: M56 family metallopeptidase [Maricaulaceae bacterium]|jgi:beta-lactamase regulating signal transducer with metallopeptidase domain
MDSGFATNVLLWLATYAVHSTLLLGGVWAFERLWKRASPALLATLWRAALVAGVASASLQASGLVQPIGGRLPVAMEQTAAAPARPEIEQLVLDQPAPPPAPMSVPAGASSEEPRNEIVAAPAGSSALSRPAFTPPNWRQLLVGIWALIACALGLRHLLSWRDARRMLADRMLVAEGPVLERYRALAREAGVRAAPRLTRSARTSGPFTLPSGEICLPDWALDTLRSEQLDAMIAHELAHAVRRDPLWQAIGMAVGAVFFFQPLNALARKRFADLAELSADDWAARRSGGGRALAECLLEVANLVEAQRTPAFAAAMAGSKSTLVARVERLLEGRSGGGGLPRASQALAAVCAVGLAVCMPQLVAHAQEETPAEEATAETQDESESRNVSFSTSRNGEVSIRMTSSNPLRRLHIEAEGEIDLAPDGSGVTALSNGGYVDVELRRNGRRQRVRFTGEGGGVERAYWVNGRSVPWGPDADDFVVEVMPIVFRQTGVNAEERVAWLLEERGEDAVLDEIELIGSDAIQQRYAELYTEAAEISPSRLDRLFDVLGERMGSDSNLRATLITIFETQSPDGPQLAQLLRAGLSIGSDSDARHLLETVVEAPLGSDDVVSAYLEVANTIGSDSDVTRALSAFVASQAGSPAHVARALETGAGSIGSDTDARLLLEVVVESGLFSDEVIAGYFGLADSIGSDTDLRQALSLLIASDELSDAHVAQALELAGENIGSDFDLSYLLRQIAERVGDSDALAEAYARATDAIGSDSDCAGALRVLADDARLSAAGWRALLGAAHTIGSDSDLASLLVAVADRLPDDESVRAAYLSAAETVGSDSAHERVMLALG